MASIMRRMFFIAVIMAFICSRITLALAEGDCASSPDRASLIECLVKETEAVETQLKLQLSAIKAASDEEHKALLEKSQLAWMRYRDTECEFEGDSYRGGTLQEDQPIACNLSEVKARLQELKNDLQLSAH